MDLVGIPADTCAEYPFGAVALRVRVFCAVTHGHEGGRRRSLRRARRARRSAAGWAAGQSPGKPSAEGHGVWTRWTLAWCQLRRA